jgi:hypothetical protein
VKRVFGGLRWFGLVFVATLLCSGAMGCALFSSPNASFVAGMDAGLNQSGLLDEYDKYVEADASLKDPNSKKIRHDTATSLRKLLKDAQAANTSPVTAPPPAPTPVPPNK